MAEGYIKYYAGNKASVYSAGIEAHGVNPKAIAVMNEDGIDISHNTSNIVDEYMAKEFDIVITVCDNARENCPYFPGTTKMIHQDFPDPAKSKGTAEEVMKEFRDVRDKIKSFSKEFVELFTQRRKV